MTSPQFYALLTIVGEQKQAQALARKTPLHLTAMAVGDGGGSLPTPSRQQTALLGELWRAPLNELSVDPVDPSQIIAELIIPPDIGGWWVRELGLYDADGDLIAVANCPESYKPLLASGSGRTQIIRMILLVTAADAFSLTIDPSVVVASRDFVSQKVDRHEQLDDPHPQYLTAAALPPLLANKADLQGNDSLTFKVARASSAEQAVRLDQLQQAIAQGIPPGTIINSLAASPPDGYLPCNGAEVSRTTYAALFAVIGTMAGTGDGETTFTLPDARGLVLRGLGADSGLDPGRVLGSLQGDAISAVQLSGMMADPGHLHTTNAGSGRYGINGDGCVTWGPGTPTSTATTGITFKQTQPGTDETRMKNLAVNFFIKY